MSLEKNRKNPRIKIYAFHKKEGHTIAPKAAEKLITACEDGNLWQVRQLIKSGLDPNFLLSDEYYFSPLLQAITAEQWEIAQYLLSLPNIEVNIYGHYKFGVTPLLQAIEQESTPVTIIYELLEKGAEVNCYAKEGIYIYEPSYQTALIICSIKGYYKKTKILLNAGADPNLASTDGYTPLMYAVKNNSTNITKLLLNAGADPNRRANDGMTALLLAAQKQNKDIATLLQNFGAKLI